MSNLPRRLPLLLLMCLGCATSCPLVAADTSHPCASVANAGERLACYDRAFPPPPEVREAAAEQVVQEFGLERRPESLRDPGLSEAEANPDRIEGKVARIEYDSGNRRTITLENGQVWVLAEASSAGHMKPGDTVAVRKGLMGSYQLLTPAGVALRVRRVR
jgi:hypothetical protein